jgi:hypothetical protein
MAFIKSDINIKDVIIIFTYSLISSIDTPRNTDGRSLDEQSFDDAPTDLKRLRSIFAVNKMAQPISYHLSAGREKPNIQPLYLGVGRRLLG